MVSWRRAAFLFAGFGFLPSQPAGIPLLLTLPQPSPLYGDYTPSTQQFETTLWFAPNATLAELPGGGLAGLPQEQGSDGFISGTINNALLDPEDQAGVGTSPDGFGLSIAAAPDGATEYGCGQLPGQIQSGGQYWNIRTSGRVLASLAANAPGDPVEGPTGDPSNLLAEGPASGWCRPRPLPFTYSSPLASRAFWIPVAVLLLGAGLFLLSRGVRLPSGP